MRRLIVAAFIAGLPALLLAQAPARPAAPALQAAAPQSPAPAVSHAATSAPAKQTALVKQYCTGCHNDRAKAGQLSLAQFDASNAASPEQVITTEKMIRQLRAGIMHAASARRPEPDQIKALAIALESRIDRAALVNPNPGSRPFQRLNRAEYGHAIKDILGIDIDVAGLLP